MMKQITNERDVMGKTIKAIAEGYGQLAVVFADDTFIELVAYNDGDDDAAIEISGRLSIEQWTRSIQQLLRAGIVTQTEAEAEEVAALNRINERERQTYETLRRKFAPNEPA